MVTFVVVAVFVFHQNSTLTIEEFHSKLQEATNFPLRPFVIPFLKVSVSADTLSRSLSCITQTDTRTYTHTILTYSHTYTHTHTHMHTHTHTHTHQQPCTNS